MADRYFEKEVKILENSHPLLVDVDEIKALASVEDVILTAEWSLIGNIVDNKFIETADEYTLSRWERMLKLKVSDLDTLETRRFRIMSRIQERAPYSWRSLHNTLNSLLGEGNYLLERNVADKTLSIKVELTVKNQYDAVVDLLERITPVDMLLNVTLRYNSYGYLSQFTHGYLANFTHQQLREDVL